jgi:hypothetical protein
MNHTKAATLWLGVRKIRQRFGVRWQSAAATPLSPAARTERSRLKMTVARTKAPWRFASRRSPRYHWHSTASCEFGHVKPVTDRRSARVHGPNVHPILDVAVSHVTLWAAVSKTSRSASYLSRCCGWCPPPPHSRFRGSMRDSCTIPVPRTMIFSKSPIKWS